MIVVPKVATHSRAAMPSRLQDINKPKDMPYRIVAITMLLEQIWALTHGAPLPGCPLPPSPNQQILIMVVLRTITATCVVNLLQMRTF
jgi:hypothetical protein